MRPRDAMEVMSGSASGYRRRQRGSAWGFASLLTERLKHTVVAGRGRRRTNVEGWKANGEVVLRDSNSRAPNRVIGASTLWDVLFQPPLWNCWTRRDKRENSCPALGDVQFGGGEVNGTCSGFLVCPLAAK